MSDLHCFVVLRPLYFNFYFNLVHYLIKTDCKVELHVLDYTAKSKEYLSLHECKAFFTKEIAEKIDIVLYRNEAELLSSVCSDSEKKQLYLFPADKHSRYNDFKGKVCFMQNDIDFLKNDIAVFKEASRIFMYNEEWLNLAVNHFEKEGASEQDILDFKQKLVFMGLKNTLGALYLDNKQFKSKHGLTAHKKTVLFIPTEHYPYEDEYKVISYDRNFLQFVKTIFIRPALVRHLRFTEKRLFNKLYKYCEKNGYSIVIKFRRKSNLQLSKTMINKSAHVLYDEFECPSTLLSLMSISSFAVVFYKSMIINELRRFCVPTVTLSWKSELYVDDILGSDSNNLFQKNNNKLVDPQQFLTHFK
jgi:hypothetical protein